MKLYDFEKYYLRLTLYKTFLFIDKVFRYKIAQYLGMVILFIVSITITFYIVIYFFIGVNVVLEKVNLKQYRIEKIPIMKSEFDLKPYFKK